MLASTIIYRPKLGFSLARQVDSIFNAQSTKIPKLGFSLARQVDGIFTAQNVPSRSVKGGSSAPAGGPASARPASGLPDFRVC